MKLTYTIPALCAVLGKPIPIRAVMQGEMLMGSVAENGGYSIYKILSPNDLIPTDECEHCELKKFNHHGKKLSCMTGDDGVSFDESYFKPLLRKVKTIKLTEVCECGEQHISVMHIPQKEGGHSCFGIVERHKCPCKQYKPVQTVEIEVE